MRLLQLASPALPVGAYSYSQGLEWAVARRAIVRDAATAAAWIGDLLEHVMAHGEAAVPGACSPLPACADWPAVVRWNDVVPRVARDGRAARGDAADGRLAREAR